MCCRFTIGSRIENFSGKSSNRSPGKKIGSCSLCQSKLQLLDANIKAEFAKVHQELANVKLMIIQQQKNLQVKEKIPNVASKDLLIMERASSSEQLSKLVASITVRS